MLTLIWILSVFLLFCVLLCVFILTLYFEKRGQNPKLQLLSMKPSIWLTNAARTIDQIF